MFGVASTFRKSHGEAAFQALARAAFDEADDDGSGCIDMSELQKTLTKMGMKLTDQQTLTIVDLYDEDDNHELDFDEFVLLCSDLIDGTAVAKLPLAARKEFEKVAARGVVSSIDDLFGSDDDEPKKKPPPKKAPPKPAASATKPAAKPASTAAKPPVAGKGGAAPSKAPAAAPPKPLPAAEAAKLKSQNDELSTKNRALEDRVKQLEAQLTAKGT